MKPRLEEKLHYVTSDPGQPVHLMSVQFGEIRAVTLKISDFYFFNQWVEKSA